MTLLLAPTTDTRLPFPAQIMPGLPSLTRAFCCPAIVIAPSFDTDVCPHEVAGRVGSMKNARSPYERGHSHGERWLVVGSLTLLRQQDPMRKIAEGNLKSPLPRRNTGRFRCFLTITYPYNETVVRFVIKM
jgi:hypothetical protein